MKKVGKLYFFKPDQKKIAIFVILGVVLFNINWLWTCRECYDIGYYHGFPLPVYSEGGYTVIGSKNTFYYPIGFIIDVIIWYLLSCLVVWIYDKFRKSNLLINYRKP